MRLTELLTNQNQKSADMSEVQPTMHGCSNASPMVIKGPRNTWIVLSVTQEVDRTYFSEFLLKKKLFKAKTAKVREILQLLFDYAISDFDVLWLISR